MYSSKTPEINKSSMVPAIYDNDTHYVANHRLTSEMLEQICNNEDVLEVAGEYTGGIRGCGASQSIESIGNYKYAMVILIDQNRVVLNEKLSISTSNLLPLKQEKT